MSSLKMAQPINNQQNSRLFALPAELRNQIYGMVFECDEDKDETIEIIDAFTLAKKFRSDDSASDVRYSLPPPSSALLGSCQRVYFEAKNMNLFAPAWECYWRKNCVIDFDKNSFEDAYPGYVKFVAPPGLQKCTVIIRKTSSTKKPYTVSVAMRRREDGKWLAAFEARHAPDATDFKAMNRIQRCLPYGETFHGAICPAPLLTRNPNHQAQLLRHH